MLTLIEFLNQSMALTKGEEPLLSESKRAELNRIDGKIEKMEAKSYKLKDEKSEN